MKSNSKGITLIALIITIIVMLIMVLVTINVAANGGLFYEATNASTETQKAADKEELLSAVIESYDAIKGEVVLSDLERALGSGWKKEGSDFPYTFTKIKTGNSFLVYKDGTIGEKSTSQTKNYGTLSISLKDGYSQQGAKQIEINYRFIFTRNEAIDVIYDALGVEDKTIEVSKLVEYICNEDLEEGEERRTYTEIKGYFADLYDEDPLTLDEDTVLMMILVNDSYKIISLQDLAYLCVIEDIRNLDKRLKINGQEISTTWLGEYKDYTEYKVTEPGTYTVELEMAGKTAWSQITIEIVQPEEPEEPEENEILISDRRFYIFSL